MSGPVIACPRSRRGFRSLEPGPYPPQAQSNGRTPLSGAYWRIPLIECSGRYPGT